MESQKECGIFAYCSYLVLVAQTVIGILTKANYKPFKDTDKAKIPTTQLALCDWPFFGYVLMMIVTPSFLRYEWIVGIMLVFLSCVTWSAYLLKHKMRLHLYAMLPAVVLGIIITLFLRGYFFTHWLGVIAQGVLDYLLWRSIWHYIEQAKTHHRRTLKNYINLSLQTVFELCLILFGCKHTGLIAYLLVLVGLIECVVIWLLDLLVKLPPPPPEEKVEEAVALKDSADIYKEVHTAESKEMKAQILLSEVEDEIVEKAGKPPPRDQEPNPESKPEPEPEPESKSKPEPEPEPESKSKSKLEPEPEPEPEIVEASAHARNDEPLPPPAETKAEAVLDRPPEPTVEAPVEKPAESTVEAPPAQVPEPKVLINPPVVEAPVPPPEKKEAVEETKQKTTLPVEEIQPVLDPTAKSPGAAKEPIKIMRIIKSNLLEAAQKFVAKKADSKEVTWKNAHCILALDCSGKVGLPKHRLNEG